MKKTVIFNILLLLLMTACYDRGTVTIGDMGEISDPVLSNNLSNNLLVINEDNLEDTLELFRWTPAEFGFAHRNPDYVLQMDLAGSNFQNSVSLITTNELKLDILVARVNQHLLALGAVPGEEVTVEFKLIANIGASLGTESNVISIRFVAMAVVIDYPELYVAGDHNGWTFTDMIWSFRRNNVYEGYIWMDNGANWNKFKMSMVPDWVEEHVIGDPNPSGTSGTLQWGNWGGNNINATEGIGYYRIVADLNRLTYQVFITNWAVTGDFNGWAFTPMQFDVGSKTWSLTADLTVGGFKFIANENWSLTYGDDEMDRMLNPGHDGNNIQITEAGNYTIILNLHEVPYRYSVTKN